MGPTISTLNSLPPLQDLLHPNPETYTQILNIWQYFASFTVVIWLTTWFPMGKTSLKSSIFNIPGRLAWTAMELIAPLNLIYVMKALVAKLNTDLTSLPLPNQTVAALYLIHYANRAVISPLFAAPSMSPIHAFIAVCGLSFNWINSTCLAAWLVGYHVPVTGYRADGSGPGIGNSTRPAISDYLPYIGIVLFFVGMAGNIISERTFFRLRREEADKLHNTQKDHSKNPGTKNKYSKVYVIPPAKGLFRYILYPHYVFEWLEWTGFVLVGTAVYPAAGAVGPEMGLVPWLRPAAALAEKLRVPLPLPAVVFVVNVVTSMVPQARLGKRWYLGRFGKDKVAGRGAVVPFLGWLSV
ncbi:steroid reductase [Aspergillus oryzae 100-8]|uniref:Steroid reductase n=1 Tax=Aspergillus oryzae (strain 3.042) TaxID=1160506 RepID=I8TVF8_ASPO3|nr:steroid reductase [Aspergillus oryzae 3.042]KDE82623.1 steroid reductase [Aspergillus oryzae 100-8]|eukprot:EIT78385.1 steroid reductase [Aspergillus oryzae 3.042]